MSSTASLQDSIVNLIAPPRLKHPEIIYVTPWKVVREDYSIVSTASLQIVIKCFTPSQPEYLQDSTVSLIAPPG